MDSLVVTTDDGCSLAADLVTPADPIAGAALCHPHPRFGGDRFHPVVDALFRELPGRGVAALRFDFRREHANGIGERNDVIAALDALSDRFDIPLLAAGYSFGAAVILATGDPRITAIAAIAPPLSMMSVPTPAVPTLVMSPRHDQFCPPDETSSAIAAWPNCSFDVIESADHFLLGHAPAVAERAATWLVSTLAA